MYGSKVTDWWLQVGQVKWDRSNPWQRSTTNESLRSKCSRHASAATSASGFWPSDSTAYNKTKRVVDRAPQEVEKEARERRRSPRQAPHSEVENGGREESLTSWIQKNWKTKEVEEQSNPGEKDTGLTASGCT
jgi:ribosomal protein L20